MSKALESGLRDLRDLLTRLFEIASASLNLLCSGLDAEAMRAQAKSMHHEAEAVASKLESKTVLLFIHFQPVASDLRKIKSAISVSYDLNRIAEMCSHATRLEVGANIEQLQSLLKLAINMVSGAATCYFNADKALAASLCTQDDSVDECFLALKKQLVKQLRLAPNDDDTILDCLLVAKYLERIADHAVNIARSVLA